jgi:hypothetical protein
LKNGQGGYIPKEKYGERSGKRNPDATGKRPEGEDGAKVYVCMILGIRNLQRFQSVPAS